MDATLSLMHLAKMGPYYRNCKGTDSIVLLGLADAEYKFIYSNIGINEHISDGGVLRESGFLETLENLNLPGNETLQHVNCHMS